MIAGAIRRLRERRLGFEVDEVMTGEHRFEPGFGPPGAHFMEFRVTWGPRDVTRWLDPRSEHFLTQALSGTMTVDGLFHEAPCRGTLALRYWSERAIRYAIDIDASGRSYHYDGEKRDIRLSNLPVSHTTCYGRLTDSNTGALVSTSVTRFHVRTLPATLASVRLV